MKALLSRWFGASKPIEETKVLVVEDDLATRPLVERLLKKRTRRGLKVHWASSAEEANQYLSTNNYRLVIADIFLAGKETGFQLWEGHKGPKDPPFLLMSGMTSDEYSKMISQSVDAPPYLQKPLHPEEAARLFDRFIR